MPPKPLTILGENDWVRVVRGDRYSNLKEEEVSQIVQMPDPRGGFFLELLRSWAMVAAKTDAEDTQGRAMLTFMTVEEAVQRAADISESAYSEMGKRGWLLKLDRPTITDED